MKILLLYNRLPFPLNDGGNLAVAAILNGLKSEGHTVHLLAMNTTRHYIETSVLEQAFPHLNLIQTVDVNNDINWKGALVSLLKNESYHLSRFQNEEFQKKLIELLQSNEYDIVQFEGLFVSMYLPDVLKWSNAKPIYRQHNIEYKIWEENALSETSFFKKKYLQILSQQLKKYELAFFEKISYILPISKKEMQENINLGFKGLQHWTPFGIESKSDSISPHSFNVYHIGAMDWMPNQEGVKWFLTEVWSQVIKAVPQAHFYFAGRNMPDSFYQFNNQSVTCMGTVPDAQMFEKDKSILIVPLHAAAGIRIKTLQALAIGKAVVSTPIGAEGLEMQAGPHFLEGTSTTEFANQIIRLLQNEDLFREVARNGQQFVADNYLNVNIIKGMIDFYNKVIYS